MKRFKDNPIITPVQVKPSSPDMEVIGAFNPGATRCRDEIVLMLRIAERPRMDDRNWVAVPMLNLETDTPKVKTICFPVQSPSINLSDPRAVEYQGRIYLSSISHLRMARSRDGVHFDVDPEPTLFPEAIYEEYGIEDPRITYIEGVYYITYTAVSRYGVAVGLASTTDFRTFERHGLIFHHENKNAVLFPQRVKGRFVSLHRPMASPFIGPNIWLSYSPDLLHWGNHGVLMGTRHNAWDALRIGAGAPPIETSAGWLCVYHGVNPMTGYGAGTVLLDLDDPSRVIARSEHALLTPEEPYEVNGFFARVVFPTGLVQEDDDRLLLYYGVADEGVAVAETTVKSLLNQVKEGELVYAM